MSCRGGGYGYGVGDHSRRVRPCRIRRSRTRRNEWSRYLAFVRVSLYSRRPLASSRRISAMLSIALPPYRYIAVCRAWLRCPHGTFTKTAGFGRCMQVVQHIVDWITHDGDVHVVFSFPDLILSMTCLAPECKFKHENCTAKKVREKRNE